jgi:hypothetical protein
MVVKFRNTICPPPPQLSLHRRAALSSNSNGTRSYISERTQNSVYIVRCLCLNLMILIVFFVFCCCCSGLQQEAKQKNVSTTFRVKKNKLGLRCTSCQFLHPNSFHLFLTVLLNRNNYFIKIFREKLSDAFHLINHLHASRFGFC